MPVESQIYKFVPVESMAKPCGLLKVALVPVPLTDEAVAEPATVVITPAGVHLRILFPSVK